MKVKEAINFLKSHSQGCSDPDCLVCKEIQSAWATIEKALDEKYYPDTEADGYVFCGKCGSLKPC
jgi:hypothetical protein